jgi:ribosome biogenesis GTPase / thiamine phosphate phosphatase
MKATVLKSTGSWYTVLTESGEKIDCRIKGIFRTKDIKSTNPVAVGDHVLIELEPDQDTGLITELLERENHIIRKSANLSKQTQIIAANIDQALLVVTLANPRTSFGFIDRFLVTAEAYHIPALLIFNKIDIYEEEDIEFLGEVQQMYKDIGYESLQISGLKSRNIDALKSVLKGKTSLISGHSGVGKSTLINKLIPELDLKTSEISGFSNKGVHTTTFAEMFPLAEGGYIIDTPGIKEFGLVDLKPEEISHYFPEMKERLQNCRFNNCMHVNEPGCAIKKAVDDSEISLTRYESYLSILINEDNRK